MVSVIPLPTPATLRRIHQIQTITIAWMIAEACVLLWAAWIARSPALLAFGTDSAIELLSAGVVVWRFREQSESERLERQTARIGGALLFAVAVCVAAFSVASLLGYHELQPSYLGMAVLALAAVIMPWLAQQKRRLSAMTQSAALRADAAESALCAYLSWIALVGIGLNTIWHIGWADSATALIIVPLIVREGFLSMRGLPCDCCRGAGGFRVGEELGIEIDKHLSADWCREGESNPHSPFGPADFKSAASANFAIPARAYSSSAGRRGEASQTTDTTSSRKCALGRASNEQRLGYGRALAAAPLARGITARCLRKASWNSSVDKGSP